LNRKKEPIYELYDVNKASFDHKYLAPGKYHLKVTARKNGILMDQKVIQLIVPKNLFEKIWFWISLFTLFTSLIFFLIYSKERQNQRLLIKDLKISTLQNEKHHF